MRRNRSGKERAFRCANVACLFTLFFFGPSPAAEEGDTDSPATSGVAVEVEAISGSTMDRMRISLDSGLFLPVGEWSEGFGPGIPVGAGFDLPLREGMDIGGRFSWFVLNRDDHTTFRWLSMETQVTFYPPIDVSRVEPFIAGRSGLLLAAVEVGEGREEEWDLLVGAGGGIRVPISEDFHFEGTAMWRKVLAEGQGFHFGVGLSFYPF